MAPIVGMVERQHAAMMMTLFSDCFVVKLDKPTMTALRIRYRVLLKATG